MSDADRYTSVTVVGPYTAAALAWLRRAQGWEHRLGELRDEPDHGQRPPRAA